MLQTGTCRRNRRRATQLSPALRKTFQLRDLDGLSIGETAHLLGVPDGTVKVQLARGRVTLKEIVRKSLRGNGDAIRCTPAGGNPEKRLKRSYGALQLTHLFFRRLEFMLIEVPMWAKT